MDYEKAYKEALEKARNEYVYHDSPEWMEYRQRLEKIFPDLAESDDEKIRKMLLNMCDDWESSTPCRVDKCNVPGVRAWLEKQGEQKPKKEYSYDAIDDCVSEWLMETRPKFDKHDGAYYTHNSLVKLCQYVLSNIEQKPVEPTIDFERGYKQGFSEAKGKFERKPAEWNKDYREEDLRTRFAFYTYKNEEDDGTLYLSNVFVEEASRNKGFGTKILIAAEKVAEVIGASCIRLKVKQNTSANAWYRKNGYGYMTFEDGYDWLEKRLEYLKPKQEWDGKDEEILNTAITHLYCYAYPENPAYCEEAEKCVAWLKKRKENEHHANEEYWRGYKEGKKNVEDKLKERKPAYHKFRVGDTIRHKEQGFTCKVVGVDTEYRLSGCMGNHLPFETEDFYELVEQKPAEWSEEDETCIENILWCIEKARKEAKDVCDLDACKTAKRFVEFLRPQPKQEWSEEDKQNLEETLYFIREFQQSNRCKDEGDMQNSVTCQNWLKSLRPQPKRNCKECAMFLGGEYTRPLWKPSEEQMDALDEYIWAKEPNKDKGPAVISLYEDLKKLL